MGSMCLQKILPNCLPKGLCNSVFPPMNQTSCCSAPTSAFGVVSVLDIRDSSMCIVASCYNLNFPHGMQCGASFHMIAVYISSLVRCLFRSFTSFLIGLFVFLLLNFEFWVYFGWGSFILVYFASVFCKYFILICGLSYLGSMFWKEALIFHVIWMDYIFFSYLTICWSLSML